MKTRRRLLIYTAVYISINLLFLESFPFVHSDEAWLSGLSRNILELGDFSATEAFFDLKPRYPHAIKLLFHAMQIVFIKLFGYRLFTFRLLSLLFGAACLPVFGSLCARLTGSEKIGLAAAVALSLDIQFIYAAHFARQEIIVLFLLLLTLWFIAGSSGRRFLFAGLSTGLCIGIHPNSFVVGCAGAAAIICGWLAQRKINWRSLAQYAAVTATFAAVFVALSFSFDPGFPAHYLTYGSEFEVDAPIGAKLAELIPYFQRLFYRVSGTYYTPDIRPQLILSVLLLLAGIIGCILIPSMRKRLLTPAGAMLGLLGGFVLIGRYNQPYVVFFFPVALLIGAVLLARLRGKAAIALILVGVVSGIFSFAQIYPWLNAGSYSDYLAGISAAVPPDARTVANLNADYAFENGSLLDYRNLSFLRQNGLTLEEYIDSREVEYLVVSDELRLIHSLRPRWNGIYGNIDYLDELDALIDKRCEQVAAFTDNLYGVRIVRFQNGEESFNVRIYKVLPE